MDARLIDAQGREFVLPVDKPAIVGRLPQCTIAIAEPSISREHAKIFLRNGIYYLVDLSSANGTFVNGKRITRGELNDGDQVTLGSAQLKFKIGMAAPAVAAPSAPII